MIICKIIKFKRRQSINALNYVIPVSLSLTFKQISPNALLSTSSIFLLVTSYYTGPQPNTRTTKKCGPDFFQVIVEHKAYVGPCLRSSPRRS